MRILSNIKTKSEKKRECDFKFKDKRIGLKIRSRKLIKFYKIEVELKIKREL